MIEQFKRDEIRSHLEDYLAECDSDKIAEYKDDLTELHNDAFNMDYYIIGTWQATEWLGDRAFQVIEFIKEYEQDNFGEVFTDLSSPESVVNMFTYIIGEQLVYNESDSFLS
tara:strand:+ start:709 stop:1044 length:336 start_codon:yes stop_codon:yes gene_type:complete